MAHLRHRAPHVLRRHHRRHTSAGRPIRHLWCRGWGGGRGGGLSDRPPGRRLACRFPALAERQPAGKGPAAVRRADAPEDVEPAARVVGDRALLHGFRVDLAGRVRHRPQLRPQVPDHARTRDRRPVRHRGLPCPCSRGRPGRSTRFPEGLRYDSGDDCGPFDRSRLGPAVAGLARSPDRAGRRRLRRPGRQHNDSPGRRVRGLDPARKRGRAARPGHVCHQEHHDSNSGLRRQFHRLVPYGPGPGTGSRPAGDPSRLRRGNGRQARHPGRGVGAADGSDRPARAGADLDAYARANADDREPDRARVRKPKPRPRAKGGARSGRHGLPRDGRHVYRDPSPAGSQLRLRAASHTVGPRPTYCRSDDADSRHDATERGNADSRHDGAERSDAEWHSRAAGPHPHSRSDRRVRNGPLPGGRLRG